MWPVGVARRPHSIGVTLIPWWHEVPRIGVLVNVVVAALPFIDQP